jgi:hypothetical protein
MREIITSVVNCLTQRIAIKALDETATPFEGIKGNVQSPICIAP